MRLGGVPTSQHQKGVSIHASVKDATPAEILKAAPVNVSIHASVKDATFGLRYWWRISFVSIHASVKDATAVASVLLISVLGFNPRICKRCDYRFLPVFRLHGCFNPRICKRCDLPSTLIPGFLVVSIHASVKDATPCL